jgi:hypothetical protein
VGAVAFKMAESFLKEISGGIWTRKGFSAPVLATQGSCELSETLLRLDLARSAAWAEISVYTAAVVSTVGASFGAPRWRNWQTR